MPFSEATVMEILRVADVAPDGVPHVTRTSQHVGPYVIPAGHTVMPSLTAVLKGDREWTDPDKFDPGRFIEGGQVNIVADQNTDKQSFGPNRYLIKTISYCQWPMAKTVHFGRLFDSLFGQLFD